MKTNIKNFRNQEIERCFKSMKTRNLEILCSSPALILRGSHLTSIFADAGFRRFGLHRAATMPAAPSARRGEEDVMISPCFLSPDPPKSKTLHCWTYESAKRLVRRTCPWSRWNWEALVGGGRAATFQTSAGKRQRDRPTVSSKGKISSVRTSTLHYALCTLHSASAPGTSSHTIAFLANLFCTRDTTRNDHSDFKAHGSLGEQHEADPLAR